MEKVTCKNVIYNIAIALDLCRNFVNNYPAVRY